MMDDYMVGFEDEIETLIGNLTEENEELDVISISGAGGIGKTTLARAIFRHPRIEYNFPVRLWVYVSSEYRVKDIFLTMLRDLSWITEDMYNKTEREIAQTLHARLENEKFLIVLDDLWTPKAWDDLQIAFPRTNKMKDFEIPVERLILLWIAEGFIQQKPRISLEETANEYLEDLITRNLITVDKEKDENMYGTSVSELQRIRRASISSKFIISFLSSQPYGPHVRSFLHSSREEIILLPENVSAIPDAFKLLRVLDVRAITFTRFPFYLTQLVHLRYIALSSDFKVLPEAISKLWNIQTIIVFTSSRILEIKADILKMIYLRHLETNASIILCKKGESGNGESIQVLANLSPESCTGDLFERTSNLKKLGIRGRLTILLNDMSGSSPFDNLEKLHQLENLKLLNDVHIHPDEAKLPCLPPPNKFPPQLISLTLSYTLLEWEQMSVLGMLDHLRVLKLKNSAFQGERWEAVDGGFRQLEVFQMQYTDLVVWEASSHHFPKLQHLKLRNCEELEALPFGLAKISSLHVIDLYRTTKSATASARKIQNEIESHGGRLKLSIFPIDE
ncbi:putative inactive disease susceptibility protein LOV1 [Sesamum angolense]|uniref:Inactive disease susceptibility protein LOV1 n=1 Tax=Sesamum angolense TaxID=2727404 RepID=A0AAE2BRY8_9LAMI|nr:putative inactive disease susceptibility protein LOV1 [Sesamum angolense]